MFNRQKTMRDPSKVFTPRAPEVTSMYVARPLLEDQLQRAINGTYHVIIHGDSGTGKTWLYQKVFKEMDVHFVTANMAQSAIKQSIVSSLADILGGYEQVTKKGFTETKEAGINVLVSDGRLAHEGEFVIGQKPPFEALLEYMRKSAKNRPAFIVFDNLEAVFDHPDLMEELGNLIILLDDRRIARHRVRFLIVGVPSEIKVYFSRTKNLQSVANRLQEVPEVARLGDAQVQQFVEVGFVDKLKVSITPELLSEYVGHIGWITMGIPQRLHEYCLEIAYLCERNNWCAQQEFLREAEHSWLMQSFTSNVATLESLMNSNRTSIGRRNQVLYSLGCWQQAEFRASDIESVLKREFPKTSKVKMSIGQILGDIASHPAPPIKRVTNDRYVFTDPKFCICIRMMLKKRADETVEKVLYQEQNPDAEE